MKRASIPIFCLLSIFTWQVATSQPPPTRTIQPKIMVIPKIKEGQNLKTVYDSDDNIRVALAKIDEAFLKRGANLVSFDAKLKEANQNELINKSSGNQADYKSMVLQMSGADIYVEAEVNVVRHTQRNANSVTVTLEGYQTGTSNFLAVKEGNSRINQTEDIGLLTAQAMDTITQSFLNLLQLKFDDIVANGQSIYVQFSLGANAKVNFDSEIPKTGKLLSELIDDWFQKNAKNGAFNNQGVTGNMLIISDARIPLKNPNNPQANYTGQNFYTDINKYLRSLGLQVKREIGTNNKILITIL
jgi:hypothetical protein